MLLINDQPWKQMETTQLRFCYEENDYHDFEQRHFLRVHNCFRQRNLVNEVRQKFGDSEFREHFKDFVFCQYLLLDILQKQKQKITLSKNLEGEVQIW